MVGVVLAIDCNRDIPGRILELFPDSSRVTMKSQAVHLYYGLPLQNHDVTKNVHSRARPCRFSAQLQVAMANVRCWQSGMANHNVF